MKEHEREEFEKLEALRKTIEASPLTQQIIAEKAAEVLSKRKAAAEKIETLKKLQVDIIPKRDEIEELVAKLAILDEERRTLQAAINQKQAVLARERQDIEGDIRQQQEILYSTYDPRIDEALEFFRNKLDDLRKPGRISTRGLECVKNLFMWSKTLTTETNEGAVLGAMRYCLAAIKGLEELKLSAEFHIEKIQELKAGLPSIEVYQEVTGEKSMEKINTDPRSLFKSDSQMAWELERLSERFKKVMGKPF